ncbi:MAG TPA: efflux RND transporter permease subunit, partial [Armatimonadota bacterium]|nr:efflux RND transporter permease subunit [Armatimonadota bacterium]
PIVTAMLSSPESTVVRGRSMFGSSFVYVLFEETTDIYWARSRVLEYLNTLQAQLPEDAAPMLGPDATGVGWGFEYALVDKTGQNDLQELRAFQDYHLKYWLSSVDGVSEVASVGGFQKQYQITLDPARLLAYNLPLKKIITSVKAGNSDVGGRTIEMAGREYFIRGRGYVENAEDLESIVVGADGDGTPILIRDVATVQLGPDIRRGAVELDGEGECVGGIVVVRFGENVLTVVEDVKERIKEIEAQGSLPDGVEIIPTYDRTELIHAAVKNLEHALFEEILVVCVIITIFLLHFRSALVAIVMLPLAVLISFIPMYYAGLTSNIMSLAGIAIAIGEMVDAACVIIENVHKRLEDEPPDVNRLPIIIDACQEVGKPIFFSLLIITVSFMPVFVLEGREGRLFKPLAYTKTFSMLAAAILSVTLVPAMIAVLIKKGKIWKEKEHPVSRIIQRLYAPWVSALMRRRGLSILIAVVAVASCIPITKLIGSEFMPPLYEGDFLYMPVTKPGASVTETVKSLQMQDQIFMQFPEVEHVFGKIGRADTATDPAPLVMVETTIMLKDRDEWREVPRKRWYSSWMPAFLKGPLRWIWPEVGTITAEQLEAEMRAAAKMPGWTDAGLPGPIDIRIGMLSTGVRGEVGIRILGTGVEDLEEIEEIGRELEGVLAEVEGTASADAQRVMGGYFLDITPDREKAARYGLNVEDVNDVVMTAIGGMPIDTTIEGAERHSIALRYGRELRETPSDLARVLVPTPTGAQVPIGQIARIRIVPGPPMIENEDGQVSGLVTITLNTDDLGAYVKRAKQAVNEAIDVPEGYQLKWVGKYEAMERMSSRLLLVIPATLAIVIVML